MVKSYQHRTASELLLLQFSAMALEKVLIAIDGMVVNGVINEVNDQPVGKPQE
jgi:hypothetical protein